MKHFSRVETIASTGLLAVAMLTLLPAGADAHTMSGGGSDLLNGLSHPMHGIDHILAGIAVGILAAQRRGSARWLMPLCFVAIMALAGVAGASGIVLPSAEEGIVASLLALGLMIAAVTRLPLAVGMTMVALFALCHGHVHGAEMVTGTALAPYIGGLSLATLLLHLAGIGAAELLRRLLAERAVRFSGAAIAVAGMFIWLI